MPIINTNVDNTYILGQLYLIKKQLNSLGRTVATIQQENSGGSSSNNNGVSVSGAAFFADFGAFSAAAPAVGDVSVLDSSTYGGGVFTAQLIINGFSIDGWSVFGTAASGIVWVRQIEEPNVVKLSWFNVVNGYTSDIIPAVTSAVTYLTSIGGGTIEIGGGSFNVGNSLYFNADNITFKGAGQGVTILNTQSGLSPNSGYRYVGWQLSSSSLITYDDSALAMGRGYLDLRVSGDAVNLTPGTKVFINGGSSHYDQNYGEFNIVDKVIGSRVYFKYNLSRDYSQGLSSWQGTLTQDFTPPAEGTTATIHYSGDQVSAVNNALSIGNDLYNIISSTSNTALVQNVPNKGNGTSVLPTGTHLFKYRAIVLTPTTVYNTKVQDLTINSNIRLLTLSNSIKTHVDRVTFVSTPILPFAGGVWMDGDDGRDFLMDNCESYCNYLLKCQFARSFADIVLCRSKFFNAALEFSEFNSNVDVYANKIHIHFEGQTNEVQLTAITTGQTCNNIRIRENDIYASNINNVFATAEIQVFNATGARDTYITNNVIACDNIGTVFANGSFSNIQILNNTLTGKANILYGMNAGTFLADDGRKDSAGRFGFGSRCVVKNNYFSGYVDGFATLTANGEFISNYTNRFGPANAQNEVDSWGNLFYHHFTPPTQAEHFVFKDNVFKNWNLNGGSTYISFPEDDRVEICNNRFLSIDNTGTTTIIGTSCAITQS